YLLFMLVTSVRGYKLLLQALTLQYENQALVEDLSVSNKKLLLSYHALEQHEHEIALINTMNSILQACSNSSEAYDNILITAKELFVGYSGGLSIFNIETKNMELITHWGDHQLLRTIFSMN